MQSEYEEIPERAQFFRNLRAKTPLDAAFDTLHAIDTMNPMDMPLLPGRSVELMEVMRKSPAVSVPPHLKSEFLGYVNAVKQRANTRGENTRRLRTLLWAEALLRSSGYEEHEVLRDFNRDVWMVPDAASDDYAIREQQLSRR